MQQRNPLENKMTTFRITEFRVRTDIVVVGSHPEMADASNPHGELYGADDEIALERKEELCF